MRLDTLLRYGILGVNALTARGLDALGRHARKLESRIDGIGSLEIAPLTDIPVPNVDLAADDDPVPLILRDPRWRDTVAYFSRHASHGRSLLSTDAQALLHVLVRNLRADHVIEIGVFKAATTEAIARALHANGRGVIHAVDPYRSEYIAAIFGRWPPPLVAHASFYPCDSVQFFHRLSRRDIRPSLALIDGNHDYEFAAFDIESAARVLTGGGFLAVDNVSQPGPFLAARDFLDRSPGWMECGGSTAGYDRSKAYDRDRPRIHNTDMIILRAPRQRALSNRPWSAGQRRTSRGLVHGIRVEISHPGGTGTLHAQIILRGFGAQPAEVDAAASVPVSDTRATVEILLAGPLALSGDFTHFTVEPNLIWQGPEPLQLAHDPQVF